MADGDSLADRRVDATIAILPFVAFALVSIAFVVLWAPDPRWGAVIVLPFAFMIAITWLAFGPSTD